MVVTKSQLNLYTGGSKTSGGVGSGAVLYYHSDLMGKTCCKLPDSATVFMAELQAIKLGVDLFFDLLNKIAVKPKFMKIFCDSQAALLALNNRMISSELVEDVVCKLGELTSREIRVSLVWIKAHVNHKGNEIADELAKRGTELDPELMVRVPKPKVYFENELESAIDRRWADDWSSYRHGRQTKIFIQRPDKKISQSALGLSRRDLSRLVSAITGHGPFGYHQHLLNPEVNQMCRYCGDALETFEHFVTVCPLFVAKRLEILGFRESDYVGEWEVETLVRFINKTSLDGIFLNVECPAD